MSNLEEMHKLAKFGGRWSAAARAGDDKEMVQQFLEKRGVPYTLTYHPRPGWQFIIDAKDVNPPAAGG